MLFRLLKMECFVFIIVFVTILARNAEARCSCDGSVSAPERAIKMYHFPPSPPCRAVRMLAQVMNLELDLVMTNIMEGEQLKPEFIQMNPQHTIPTIDDNGFILWESRAIMAYLVNAYAQYDTLYPNEPKQRALVDQRLNFDQGTLFARYLAYYNPMNFQNGKDDSKMNKIVEAIGWFNSMLQGLTFSAGDNLTIADITLVVTFSNLEALGHDFNQFENVQRWYDRTKEALRPFGYKEINEAGAQTIAAFFNKNT